MTDKQKTFILKYHYLFTQRFARLLSGMLFGLRAFGRENVPDEGPVLLLSNHQSYLDPIFCTVTLSREVDFVARDSLFKNRLFGAYIRSLSAFPVQRDQADVRAIKAIIDRLKAGRVVILFPEGTRSADGSIGPIKSGFELIARRSGALTVPVVVDGAFDVWPRQQSLPNTGRIYVSYGKGIPAEQVKQMKHGEFVSTVSGQLRQMQTELRRRHGKTPFDYGDM
jgi:1-acyl-sn-glycerol-3-phosphate acyltransferase